MGISNIDKDPATDKYIDIFNFFFELRITLKKFIAKNNRETGPAYTRKKPMAISISFLLLASDDTCNARP